MNRATYWPVVLLLLSGAAFAQSTEEIVVTGTKVEGVRIPATSLKRQADFLLLKVEVTNDSREYKTRRGEIYTTLREVLAAAAKDKSIELAVIREDNVVLPLKLDDTTLNFRDTGSGGVLTTTITVKTRIESASADGAALIAK
jgi:hypothetical protein